MEDRFDLVVCGGGVAGVSSALAASKKGLKVALIEQNVFLGGLATSGLINWFEPLCDGIGNQLIFSQADDLFNLAIESGYNTYDPNWKTNGKRKTTFFDHHLFALSLLSILKEHNVTIYFDSKISDVFINNGVITGVEIVNIEGKSVVNGKMFIDATGNAFIFRKAGINVNIGDNYLVYATTTYKQGYNKPQVQFSGYSFNPKKENIKIYDGTKYNQVNQFLIDGQTLALKEYKEGKILDISDIPSMPQFRKIASIEGEYTLSNKDLYAHHDDSIGVIGVFFKNKEKYEIPFRSLYNHRIKNLLAAGRIISCKEEAWEAIRVIPVAILTGEVTGIASYLSLKKKLNTDNLQKELLKLGIKIH